ncbi:MAG: ATP synthase F0 subunit B [Deltaproteobacteria bacterium]|nr:ATP synthase F0 subunit B [Deltaproteobacteria bacterium]
MGPGGGKDQKRHGQGPGDSEEAGPILCPNAGLQDFGEGTLMRTLSVLLGLGAGLAFAGAAGAAGAPGGGYSADQIHDIIWRSVNFVVFAAILIKLVARPAKEFFAKRSQDISVTLEDLEAKKAEAAQALKEAEERLAKVAAEREKILETFVAEGELEKAKIIQKAEAVATRIKEMAAFSIQAETKKAAQELKKEVVDLATNLATDLIKEKATYADQQGLVENYLKKVVETH